MATTTTNLSLRKPETSDFVSVATDISGNMQTIDEKWASSAAANIGSAAAAGSALTVARTDHVHTVGSGTVSAPGLPIGESNSGFYRIGSANLGAAIAGALSWAWSAAGIALEAMLSLKHISTPSAPGAGYLGLYAKSDNNVYKQTPAADEVRILDADIFTAAGDIVYGTGAETFTQLAAGTSTQLLHGGTTPSWSQVVNADVSSSAAIAQTKLGAMDAVRAYKSSGAQAVDHATETTVTLDAESFDNNTMHDNVTNNSRLTAATTGLHLIWGNVAFASDPDGIREVYIRHEGSTRIATGSIVAPAQYAQVFSLYYLTAGEYVEMRVWSNHGAATTINVENGTNNTYFGMARLSA